MVQARNLYPKSAYAIESDALKTEAESFSRCQRNVNENLWNTKERPQTKFGHIKKELAIETGIVEISDT